MARSKWSETLKRPNIEDQWQTDECRPNNRQWLSGGRTTGQTEMESDEWAECVQRKKHRQKNAEQIWTDKKRYSRRRKKHHMRRSMEMQRTAHATIISIPSITRMKWMIRKKNSKNRKRMERKKKRKKKRKKL